MEHRATAGRSTEGTERTRGGEKGGKVESEEEAEQEEEEVEEDEWELQLKQLISILIQQINFWMLST